MIKTIKIKLLKSFKFEKDFNFIGIIIIYSAIMLLPRDLFVQVPGGDNFGHIYLDFLLTIIIFYIFSNFKFFNKLIIVLGLTTLIEFLQSFTTRNFSYHDLIYNFLGIYIAIIVFYFFIISKNKKN